MQFHSFGTTCESVWEMSMLWGENVFQVPLVGREERNSAKKEYVSINLYLQERSGVRQGSLLHYNFMITYLKRTLKTA